MNSGTINLGSENYFRVQFELKSRKEGEKEGGTEGGISGGRDPINTSLVQANYRYKTLLSFVVRKNRLECPKRECSKTPEGLSF